MNTYAAALIAAVASIITAVTTAIFAYRTQNRVARMQTETQASIAKMQAENQASLEKLKDDLQQKKESRQKTEKAEEVLAKYREPLLLAAFELQSRCYNIARGNVLKDFHANGNEREREYTVQNTCYVFAQYLAWTEIIRREVQFLNLGETDSNRKLNSLQDNIRSVMLNDKFGKVCRIFRGEQRAIGELMITTKGSDSFCMGYAEFAGKKETEFLHWFEPLRQSVNELAIDISSGQTRLVQLQNALVDLIDYLDPNHVRFDRRHCQKA